MTKTTTIHPMKGLRTSAAILLLALTGACGEFAVPDFNASSLDALTNNPTPLSVETAAQGLLWGSRVDIEYWVILAGTLGRETYNLSPADAGWQNILNSQQAAFYNSRFWGAPYKNIRQANIVLKAVDAVSGLTAGEKEAIKGFTNTITALDFLLIMDARDTAGAFVDVGGDPTGALPTWVPKAQVYTEIVRLLEEGKTHLAAAVTAGTTMPVKLGPGFTAFSTPAGFLKVNRAIRARVAVYLQDYTTALQALSESFVDPNQPLTLGAYHVWSTNAGDQTFVRIYDPPAAWHFAQPRFSTDAQLRADGTKDLRFTTKTRKLATAKTFRGLTSDVVPTIYPKIDGQIPIVRNEELILLRAEANLGCKGTRDALNCSGGNPAQALIDINFIRQNAGGLDPIAGAAWTAKPDTARLNELLYNKRYSLWYEGGHRWIDWRRYGMLDELPVDRVGDKRFIYEPIPQDSCMPYTPQPSGCTIPAGF